LDHDHDFGPAFKGCALENGQVTWENAVKVCDAIIELGTEAIPVQWDGGVNRVILDVTVFIGQISLVKRSAGDLTLMCSTNFIFMWNNFPVSVLRIFGLAASIMGYSFPHLETEDGKSEYEERIQ